MILVVLVGAAVFGMRRLHDRQMSLTLQFLKNTAYKSIEAKDYRSAQLQLSQYLAMKSGDAEAREKLSQLLTENIRTPQAFEQAFRLNEELLRKGHTNDDLRLRQSRIAVQLQRMTDAGAHLDVLRMSRPDDAEVWYLSAVVAEAARDTVKAVEYLKRSLRCPVQIPEPYALLAKLSNEESPPEFQPESLMVSMIRSCPTGKAYQIRADYFIDRQQHDSAIEDLWKALEETPDDMVLNAKFVRCLQSLDKSSVQSSDLLQADDEWAHRALLHFEERIDLSSQNPTFRLHLATILWKTGQRTRAMETLEAAIRAMPRSFSLHESLIEYLVVEKKHAKARRLLESIPAGGLPREAYHYCHGRILMAEQRWKEAADSFEQTLAFARKTSGLFARAQMSYAVCRSRNGESEVALDAFRTVVASSPDSTAARLGIAAAWVQSGQIEMAIAEYRALQQIPGVNAVLADLLIQKNLAQPASLRNWNDVDELLSEEDPKIGDPIQRVLLRADRWFASGHVLQAVNTLENAAIMYPDRKEVRTALERLKTDLSSGLSDRLNQLVSESPKNSELQSAKVRHVLRAEGIDAALAIIDQIEESDLDGDSVGEESSQLALRTINRVILMEQQNNRLQFIDALDTAAIELAERLASRNPKHEKELIRTLVRTGRSRDALQRLTSSLDSADPQLKADALLTLVRSTPNRDELMTEVTAALYSLVVRHSANRELRFYYAELMLFARQYDIAEQTLIPLQAHSDDLGRTSALRAWLRSAKNSDLETAEKLISSAIRENPREHVYREVQARLLLSEEKPEQALKVLEEIPKESQSLAGHVYRVAALMGAGREGEAQMEFDQIQIHSDEEWLLPADEDLLKSLSDQILQPTTVQR